MSLCVVDCSFFVSSFLPDEKNESFDFSPFSVHVPSIFFLECLNVLKISVKRKRITEDQYKKFVDFFESLPFAVDHFSSTQESLGTISRLSQEHDLSSYDASYLELALRLKAPLGTFDKKILGASKLEKVKNLTR